MPNLSNDTLYGYSYTWELSSQQCVYNSGAITVKVPQAATDHDTLIDKNIVLFIGVRKGSVTSYSNYKYSTGGQILTASSSSTKTLTKSGNIWVCTINMTDLKPDSSNSTYYYCPLRFSVANQILPANALMQITINKSLNKSYSNPSGYVLDGRYMFQTSTSNNGNDISSVSVSGTAIRDFPEPSYSGTFNGKLRTVSESNGNVIRITYGSSTVDVTSGSNFQCKTVRSYSSGYWSGTPGRRVYHSGYYYNTYYIYINGSSYWSASSASSFTIRAYCPNSANGDVVNLSW